MGIIDDPEDDSRNIDSHTPSPERMWASEPVELTDLNRGLAAAFSESNSDVLHSPNLHEPARAGSLFVDKYRLIEQIGEGGMGIVWYAEQLNPVKRMVALKLIKPGLNSRSGMGRFEAERQALAMMDHPNIARVLDGGMSDHGSPYLVMELVRGTAITNFCDQRKLDLHQRLQLFIPVCQAIQHAHQKGIIHRDIKPSNVMVALFDDKPVPKVIDFGVAKFSDSNAMDFSIHTGFGSVVGTAEYMSPEQAQLNNVDIDTRSDVYSLGVLLYELVAGSPPFQRSELPQQGIMDMLRVIREVDPQRPSLKLSSSKMRASIAAKRNTEPSVLGKLLRSELDWIVMKSLEKERARRYESVGGLARDIDRFLANEPVEACPPSTVYKLRKFLSRNRTAALSAILLVVTLLAGIVGTSIGLFRADSARRLAEIAQKAASDRAEGERQAKIDALAQKELAQQAELSMMASYRMSTDDAIKHLIGSKPTLGPHELAYLENALSRWQVFAGREGNDQRSRAIRCEGYFQLGLVWKRLGRFADAQAAFEASVSIWEKLVEDFPSNTNYQNGCADARRHLAQSLMKIGNNEAAGLQLRQALKSQEPLVAEFPNEASWRDTLGNCHMAMANLCSSLGQPEAVNQHRKALRIFEGLSEENPTDIEYLGKVAICQSNLGNWLSESGDVAEAEQLFRNSLKTMASLATKLPNDPFCRSHLAERHVSLGRFLRSKLSKPEEGMQQLRLGLEVYDKLATEFPSIPTYRRELADGRIDLGQIQTQQGSWALAEVQLSEASRILKLLVAESPDVSQYQVSLGWSYCRMGELEDARGNPQESLGWFNKAVESLTPIHESEGSTQFSLGALTYSLSGRAHALAQLKQDSPADWERVRNIIPKVGPQQSQIQRAILLLRAGKVDDAAAEMDTLIRAATSRSVTPPWSLVEWFDSACFFSLASSRAPDRQHEYANRSIELLTRAVEAGFADAAHMKHDPDLDPLRPRADFQDLLEKLDKGKSDTTRPTP